MSHMRINKPCPSISTILSVVLSTPTLVSSLATPPKEADGESLGALLIFGYVDTDFCMTDPSSYHVYSLHY